MKPKLIPKDALVAEIKRRIILLENNSNGIISMLASGMFVNEYKDLLSFLDTLEVKEVDLNKEIDFYIESSLTGTNPIYTKGGVSCIIEKTAKHFFELGIKARTLQRRFERT